MDQNNGQVKVRSGSVVQWSKIIGMMPGMIFVGLPLVAYIDFIKPLFKRRQDVACIR